MHAALLLATGVFFLLTTRTRTVQQSGRKSLAERLRTLKVIRVWRFGLYFSPSVALWGWPSGSCRITSALSGQPSLRLEMALAACTSPAHRGDSRWRLAVGRGGPDRALLRVHPVAGLLRRGDGAADGRLCASGTAAITSPGRRGRRARFRRRGRGGFRETRGRHYSLQPKA